MKNSVSTSNIRLKRSVSLLLVRVLIPVLVLSTSSCALSKRKEPLYSLITDISATAADMRIKCDYHSYPLEDVSDRTSVFIYIGYSPDLSTLAVVFKTSPSIMYIYSGIETEYYGEFYRAESLGKFFNANIKGQYECIRIDDYKERSLQYENH